MTVLLTAHGLVFQDPETGDDSEHQGASLARLQSLETFSALVYECKHS